MNRSSSHLTSTRKSGYDKLSASKRDGFLGYIIRAYNYLWAKGNLAYRKMRSFLWIGSTSQI